MVKNWKSCLIYSSIVVGLFSIFALNISYVIEKIQDDASVQETRIHQFITRMQNVSDSQIVYAKEFLENGTTEDSEYMEHLAYDDELGMYTLEFPEKVPYDAVSLTGLEEIPTDGLERQELNMALTIGSIFNLYSESWDEICWIFYTSENEYMSLYPYLSPDEFAYTKDIEEKLYYSMATPENNPTGNQVWCPIYEDSAGKGNIFTLSQPLYFESAFLGVMSVEFSTSIFEKIFTTDYNCYIINEFDQILGSNAEDMSEGILSASDYFDFTYEEVVSGMGDGSSTVVNGQYLEVLKLDNSDYFYGFILVPISQILAESFLRTLPFLLLVIILILVIRSLESRKKSYRELERYKDELTLLAITDPLTRVYNRRKFEESLHEKINNGISADVHVAIVDMDYFKNINDKLGHDTGDSVLKSFASLFRDYLDGYRERDEVDVLYARIGGEEFAIIFTGLSSEEVKDICENLRLIVEEHDFEINSNVTISVGIAKISPTDDFKKAFKKADDKLYEAKQTGRNKIMLNLEVM